MLLKDCPVGSMVRLSLFAGEKPDFISRHWWKGKFEVFNNGKANYVIDGGGQIREHIYNDEDYHFEVEKPMVIELDGVTHNMTPVKKRKTITIDGVEYEMEEVA